MTGGRGSARVCASSGPCHRRIRHIHHWCRRGGTRERRATSPPDARPETAEPVPEVVGIARCGLIGDGGVLPSPIGGFAWSIIGEGCAETRFATLAVSMLDPPPTETKPSASCSMAKSAASWKESIVGSTFSSVSRWVVLTRDGARHNVKKLGERSGRRHVMAARQPQRATAPAAAGAVSRYGGQHRAGHAHSLRNPCSGVT